MALEAPFGELRYSDYLVALVARSESAGARLAGADPDRRAEVANDARRASARLSARLDASPLTDETAARVDSGQALEPPVAEQSTVSSGGWAQALKLDGMPTQDVAAVEYRNLLACHDAEAALADQFFAEPLAVLGALHGHICQGLVAAEVIGHLRRTEQDVHDGGQGMVVYRPPPPSALPGLMGGLLGWLGGGSESKPALVVAGVVHERILEWQPFEAANGRLARAAARLVLRARGVDTAGCAVPERSWSGDIPGYYNEVAATIRRRGDLLLWLERIGESVAHALEAAADRADPRPIPLPPPRAASYCRALDPGEVVTLPTYSQALGIDRETAQQDLNALCQAGLLRPDPGTRGLRFLRD